MILWIGLDCLINSHQHPLKIGLSIHSTQRDEIPLQSSLISWQTPAISDLSTIGTFIPLELRSCSPVPALTTTSFRAELDQPLPQLRPKVVHADDCTIVGQDVLIHMGTPLHGVTPLPPPPPLVLMDLYLNSNVFLAWSGCPSANRCIHWTFPFASLISLILLKTTKMTFVVGVFAADGHLSKRSVSWLRVMLEFSWRRWSQVQVSTQVISHGQMAPVGKVHASSSCMQSSFKRIASPHSYSRNEQ
jgi:hypothetical protein